MLASLWEVCASEHLVLFGGEHLCSIRGDKVRRLGWEGELCGLWGPHTSHELSLFLSFISL